MTKPNQSYAQRCQSLLTVIDQLSKFGCIVRQVEMDAQPKPIVWVFASPALYRAQGQWLGKITDIGRNQSDHVKAAKCLGCEVRWLESHVLRARQLHTTGGRHARS